MSMFRRALSVNKFASRKTTRLNVMSLDDRIVPSGYQPNDFGVGSAWIQQGNAPDFGVVDNDGEACDVIHLTGVTQSPDATIRIVPGDRVAVIPHSRYFVGVIEFDYFATNETDGTSGSAHVTVRVSPDGADNWTTNRAPTPVGDSYAVDGNSGPHLFDVRVNDTDPDGDPLTLGALSNVIGGSAVVLNGAVQFTPAANFIGVGGFDYLVKDDRGGSATAHASVTVGSSLGHLPVAAPDFFRVRANSRDNFLPVLANDFDPDGGTVHITRVIRVGHGRVTVCDGGLLYTPKHGWSGPATIRYFITDGSGCEVEGRVTLDVYRPLSGVRSVAVRVKPSHEITLNVFRAIPAYRRADFEVTGYEFAGPCLGTVDSCGCGTYKFHAGPVKGHTVVIFHIRNPFTGEQFDQKFRITVC